MSIKENPFYILQLPCSADRRQISEAVQEQSFFQEESVCIDAQNRLSNPGHRLDAELDWFPELHVKEVKKLIEHIENKSKPAVSVSYSLSRMNLRCAELEEGIESSSPRAFTDIIVLADEVTRKIDGNYICQIINPLHQKAGLTEISISEGSQALNQKVQRVKAILAKQLELLSTKDQAEVLSSLPDALDIISSPIVSKLYESYELSVTQELNRILSKVSSMLKEVTAGRDNDKFLGEIAQYTRRFGNLAKPLLQYYEHKHQNFGLGVKLINEARVCAVGIHNEKQKVNEALAVTELALEAFPVDCEPRRVLLKDKQNLSSTSGFLNIVERILAFKAQAEELSENPTAEKTRNFCRELGDIYNETRKVSDPEHKTSFQKGLYVIASGTMIGLIKDNDAYSQAKQIILKLRELYSNDSEKRKEMDESLRMTEQLIALSSLQGTGSSSSRLHFSGSSTGTSSSGTYRNGRSRSNSSSTAGTVTLIVIVIIILVNMINSCNAASPEALEREPAYQEDCLPQDYFEGTGEDCFYDSRPEGGAYENNEDD